MKFITIDDKITINTRSIAAVYKEHLSIKIRLNDGHVISLDYPNVGSLQMNFVGISNKLADS